MRLPLKIRKVPNKIFNCYIRFALREFRNNCYVLRAIVLRRIDELSPLEIDRNKTQYRKFRVRAVKTGRLPTISGYK